jgi:hypothetical protein
LRLPLVAGHQDHDLALPARRPGRRDLRVAALRDREQPPGQARVAPVEHDQRAVGRDGLHRTGVPDLDVAPQRLGHVVLPGDPPPGGRDRERVEVVRHEGAGVLATEPEAGLDREHRHRGRAEPLARPFGAQVLQRVGDTVGEAGERHRRHAVEQGRLGPVEAAPPAVHRGEEGPLVVPQQRLGAAGQQAQDLRLR